MPANWEQVEELTVVSDCNNTSLSTGTYYCIGSALNTPSESAWFLQVLKQSDTNITQIAYRYRDNEIYERHYNTVGETGWKSWTPILSDTGWKTLTLATNWGNLGGEYFNAQYRRINKQVFLRGIVKNNTDNDYVVGTLPARI